MPKVSPAVEVSPGVHVLTQAPRSGFGWNVVVVQLPAGGTLIYNPAWLDDDTFKRIDALGEPKVLCAPNNFHHLSLSKFRARYPQAIAVAASNALPRLAQQGHAGLQPVEAVNALLPPGSQWHHCEGVKTGEVWLSMPKQNGRALLVADAFFHFVEPLKGFAGWVLKRLKVWPGLRVSTTYQFLAVRSVPAYRAWVLGELAKISATTLAVSHGAALTAPDLSAQLVRAIETRWPD